MITFWIFDREESQQGLPLSTLVRALEGTLGIGAYELLVRRSRGYGVTVCRWDGMLDHTDRVSVSFDDFSRIVDGKEEWFYELEVRCQTASAEVTFGVHDSTALFVRAPKDLALRVVKVFGDVRVP